MHSSHLRGDDFGVWVNGKNVSHADYFADFTTTTRVGIVTPDGIVGTGATTLIMAYMTAFYDRYRVMGDDFRAYPDFYTFSNPDTRASYTMLDIWPRHKDVAIEHPSTQRLDCIVDRAINILLVPDKIRKEAQVDEVKLRATERHKDSTLLNGEYGVVEFFKPQLESARRTITACFAFGRDGTVADADLAVSIKRALINAWVLTVFDSLPHDPIAEMGKWDWEAQMDKMLVQSFRKISFEDALLRL